MIHIAFCEDEKPQREYIGGMLLEFAKSREYPVVVDYYVSAEQFLFEREDKNPYDLLILDIQMGEMNGMELAKKIRTENEQIRILFLTGLKEYAIEGYEVRAVHYLLKPIKKETLFRVLSDVCTEITKSEHDWFVFGSAGHAKRICFRDILYIEAEGHYMKLVGKEEINRWKASLASVSAELEKNNFVLIRRGLYVNLSHVERIGRLECLLDTGEKLPVSKNRYTAINRAFIAYYKQFE